MTSPSPLTAFYNGVSEPLASQSVAALLPQSQAIFRTPSSTPAWPDSTFDGRRAYIRCSQDAVFPVSLQDQIMKDSKVDWIVHTVDTGHSPFLICPADLASHITALADSFQSAEC